MGSNGISTVSIKYIETTGGCAGSALGIRRGVGVLLVTAPGACCSLFLSFSLSVSLSLSVCLSLSLSVTLGPALCAAAAIGFDCTPDLSLSLSDADIQPATQQY